MAIHLGRPLPDASRDQPGRRRENPLGSPPVPCRTGRNQAAPIRSCSRWGLPCHLRYRRRGALLPHPFTLTGESGTPDRPAVCFLWHCPWGRPRRPLAGTVFPWSPDFPPPVTGAEAPDEKRSSGRLVTRSYGFRCRSATPPAPNRHRRGACSLTYFSLLSSPSPSATKRRSP